MRNKIIESIISKVKMPGLVESLAEHLSFGELQSLLIKIFELKTKKKNVNEILDEYQSNRFTKPSDIDPVAHRILELNTFSLLPEGFQIIDLSPLAPLGTSSVLTTVHQNNIVSTIRNVEVAADTTNILALECATRRGELLKKERKNAGTVKLCSSQRVTRGQPFENKNFSAYFNVIALCSAGRDTGNDVFEIKNLEEHVMFYIAVIERIVDKRELKRINIRFFSYPGPDNQRIIENIKNKLAGKEHICFRVEENSEFGKSYYRRLRFMIDVVNCNNQEFNYVDGGFADWTSKLLNNKKERLLTSGIGTDLLLRTIKTH
jgi:hypothetical protein